MGVGEGRGKCSNRYERYSTYIASEGTSDKGGRINKWRERCTPYYVAVMMAAML